MDGLRRPEGCLPSCASLEQEVSEVHVEASTGFLNVYQWRVLPFCLANAPGVFVKLYASIGACLRPRAICSHMDNDIFHAQKVRDTSILTLPGDDPSRAHFRQDPGDSPDCTAGVGKRLCLSRVPPESDRSHMAAHVTMSLCSSHLYRKRQLGQRQSAEADPPVHFSGSGDFHSDHSRSW